jgi:hypothetical protein
MPLEIIWSALGLAAELMATAGVLGLLCLSLSHFLD